MNHGRTKVAYEHKVESRIQNLEGRNFNSEARKKIN